MAQCKVQQQLIGHWKAHATLVADVGPGVEVHRRVLVKTLRLGERSSAVLALVRLVACTEMTDIHPHHRFKPTFGCTSSSQVG